jgi:hypothetical protein
MLAFSVITIIGGLDLTLTMFVRRKHCLANPYGPNPSCGSYDTSIRWAICIIIVGGTLFVIGALLATNFLKGHPSVGEITIPSDSMSDDGISGS